MSRIVNYLKDIQLNGIKFLTSKMIFFKLLGIEIFIIIYKKNFTVIRSDNLCIRVIFFFVLYRI